MRRNVSFLTAGIALLASAIVSACGTSENSQSSQQLQIALQQTQIALQQTQIALQHPTEAPAEASPTHIAAPTQPPAATPTAAKNSADPQSYAVADIFDENITPEDREAIIQFIVRADQDQINTQRYLDLSYSEHSHAGYQLLYTKRYIDELRRNGVYKVSKFYPADSYIKDIRIVDENSIAVDACEYWQSTFYSLKTHRPTQKEPVIVAPQTITIERLHGKLFITGVSFFEGAVFCTDKPTDFIPSSEPIGPE